MSKRNGNRRQRSAPPSTGRGRSAPSERHTAVQSERPAQTGRNLLSPFRVAMRIRVRHEDEIVMGSTLAELLRHIQEQGSVREAAAALRMNYDDAVDMIQGAEYGLDMNLLMRRETHNRSGGTGGVTTLTPFARRLLEEYSIFELEMVTEAEKRMRNIFIYLKDSIDAQKL